MQNNDFTQRLLADPLATVADYYARHLNAAAHAFLQRNCLGADDGLRVGFADRTLGKQIPERQYKAGRELRTKLQQVGILKASGHEALRGFVTVPLTDLDGNTTGIYGLRVDNHGKAEPQQTIGSGLFNAAALNSYEEVIICADVRDAWTFHAAGHANAIAADGLPLTQQHVSHVRRILLADPNMNGQLSGHVERMRIHFPEGTTVNQYAILNRTLDDALGKRIRAATHVRRAADSDVPSPPPAQRNSGGEGRVRGGKSQSAARLNAVGFQPAGAEREDEPTDHPQRKSPTASPTPAPLAEIDIEQSDTETIFRIESRRWRVRGLERNTTPGVMRINLMVYNERNDRFHVDTLDLYHARARRVFLKESSEETAMAEHDLRADLGRVLLQLEQLQHEQQTRDKNEAQAVQLTDEQRREAMQLLTDDRLLERILDDFDACGIVGERIGKLTGYLAATSRLLAKPLGVIIQSSSAAGKTSLLEAILAFMPPEAQFACSAMTGRSLYYAGQLDLRHKILSVAEEQGARDASYALKLLQSDGKLSIVTTAKESGTGRTAVERYDVAGPVATLMTTTSADVDPELLNRCLVLSVDEDAEQTAAIQQRQRDAETLQDILAAQAVLRIRTLHQNAQRLLRPLHVVNPYADQLTFAKTRVRNRRDNAKYLSLIKSVTLLHQYQRPVQQATAHGTSIEYIEVTRDDIAVANRIAGAVFGSSIDELPTQTRRLLRDVFTYVERAAGETGASLEDLRFTRRQLREQLDWGHTQLRIHLNRLAAYEYVHVHPGPGRTLLYELRWDGRGREGEPTLFGLTDPATLVEPSGTTNLSAAPNA